MRLYGHFWHRCIHVRIVRIDFDLETMGGLKSGISAEDVRTGTHRGRSGIQIDLGSELEDEPGRHQQKTASHIR